MANIAKERAESERGNFCTEVREKLKVIPFDGKQIKPNMKLQSHNILNKFKNLKWPAL